MAMRVLFRLLFIAYGEDKNLLPYRFNGLYQKRSLKAKAKDLLELMDSDEGFGEGDAWWQEARAIFHAVDNGNKSWGVPASMTVVCFPAIQRSLQSAQHWRRLAFPTCRNVGPSSRLLKNSCFGSIKREAW